MLKLTRRKFLAALAGAGIAATGYARCIEPGQFDVSTTQVKLPFRLRKPLRILHLSDLHASSVMSYSLIDQAVGLGLARKPDLICLTGDYITTTLEERDRYTAILKRLVKAAPTFACLGNHDGGIWAARRDGGYRDSTLVRELLDDAGIALLHNRAISVRIGDQQLRMVGVGDWWSREVAPPTLPATTEGGEDHVLTIMLSHNPDAKTALRDVPWDLMLCGHTHGGQITLPLLGSPLAPIADKRFSEGLHTWDKRWIYVTRGVGSLLGMRFNCPPEVSILELGS